MPKVHIKATELSNTDVNFIALVKRGANRIPFRLTKSEDEPMFDLYSAGKRLLFKEDGPRVIGAVYSQKADRTALMKALHDVGIQDAVLSKSDNDGVSTVLIKGADTHDALLMKSSDSVAIVISGLRKSFDGFDLAASAYASTRHVSSPTIATALYKAELDKVAKSAETPADYSAKVSKAAADFDSFMAKLTSGLPAQALKLDRAIEAGTGNANGGAGMDQETGDGLGAAANGKAKKSSDGKNLSDEGDPGAVDPEMPPKNPAKKDDAGQNGTGAGFELGEGTGTDDRATADDAANTEVDAKPGARVSGDNSGLPPKLKAPTTKADASKQLDDDSTSGAQSDVPPKAKAPTKKKDVIRAMSAVAKAMGYQVAKADLAVAVAKANIVDVTTQTVTGESQAGEGAAAALDTRDQVSDDEITDTTVNQGKPGGATLDMSGIPDKLKAPTAKADADALDPDKNKDRQLPDAMSGAGAQQKDVQTLKSDAAVMQAIAALSKAVKDGLDGVKKDVTAMNTRIDGVAAMAKKTDAALHGTVFSEAGGDLVRHARKGDSDGKDIPLLDTAFSRRGAA